MPSNRSLSFQSFEERIGTGHIKTGRFKNVMRQEETNYEQTILPGDIS